MGIMQLHAVKVSSVSKKRSKLLVDVLSLSQQLLGSLFSVQNVNKLRPQSDLEVESTN